MQYTSTGTNSAIVLMLTVSIRQNPVSEEMLYDISCIADPNAILRPFDVTFVARSFDSERISDISVSLHHVRSNHAYIEPRFRGTCHAC